MSLLTHYHKKFYLFNERQEVMASVVPLTDDIYNLGNLAGMHFQKVFNDNVNTEKLEKLIKEYNLHRVEEIE